MEMLVSTFTFSFTLIHCDTLQINGKYFPRSLLSIVQIFRVSFNYKINSLDDGALTNNRVIRRSCLVRFLPRSRPCPFHLRAEQATAPHLRQPLGSVSF